MRTVNLHSPVKKNKYPLPTENKSFSRMTELPRKRGPPSAKLKASTLKVRPSSKTEHPRKKSFRGYKLSEYTGVTATGALRLSCWHPTANGTRTPPTICYSSPN